LIGSFNRRFNVRDGLSRLAPRDPDREQYGDYTENDLDCSDLYLDYRCTIGGSLKAPACVFPPGGCSCVSKAMVFIF